MAPLTPLDRAIHPPVGPLNVLMVGLEWFSDNPGGGGRYLADIAKGLAARGHRVTVLVPRLAPEHPAAEDMDGVRVERFRAQGLAAKLAVPHAEVTRLARERGPFDVVHSHFALYGVGPLWHPAAANARRITQFQGPWAAESRVEGEGRVSVAIKHAIERLAYRRSHDLIVLSDDFKQKLTAGYGIDPAHVHVIPAAVDQARFQPPASKAAVRQALGIGPGPALFAMRRLVRRMGIEVLLDAFAKVLAAHPEATLRLAGTGPIEQELRARALSLGLGEAVSWLGRVSDADLVRHYQAADFTVVPTVALEGFGLITVESLACGTPVVGTAEGGTAEILRPFAPQLLVPPGQPDALADKLLALLAGTEPTPDGAACRRYAEAHYGWDHVLARVETVLVGGGR
ncbi:GDP-mannose-dependent alpha-(1-6)-phosphatidylinositol monomannoside mannosyltransferase [compost metagenome]